MNPHVLFLDIDGVTNNRKSMVEAVERAKVEGTGYTDFEGFMFPSRMDPDCVARLNRVVSEGGCDVVLSSTWRYGRPWEVTSRYLRDVCGFEFDLIGATERTFLLNNEGRWSYRGEEIERWREEHRDWRDIVIIDDDSDMKPHMDRLILTDAAVGLQDDEVAEVLKLLGVG